MVRFSQIGIISNKKTQWFFDAWFFPKVFVFYPKNQQGPSKLWMNLYSFGFLRNNVCTSTKWASTIVINGVITLINGQKFMGYCGYNSIYSWLGPLSMGFFRVFIPMGEWFLPCDPLVTAGTRNKDLDVLFGWFLILSQPLYWLCVYIYI